MQTAESIPPGSVIPPLGGRKPPIPFLLLRADDRRPDLLHLALNPRDLRFAPLPFGDEERQEEVEPRHEERRRESDEEEGETHECHGEIVVRRNRSTDPQATPVRMIPEPTPLLEPASTESAFDGRILNLFATERTTFHRFMHSLKDSNGVLPWMGSFRTSAATPPLRRRAKERFPWMGSLFTPYYEAWERKVQTK